MDKKTDALKLALEALEYILPDTPDQRMKKDAAISAIREALADQDSKEKEQSKTDAFIKQIDEALAEQPASKQRHISYVCPQCHWSLDKQPAQQQEPVTNYCKECLTYNGHHEGCSHYTTPPQRKPLTDEQVKAVIRAGEYDSMEEFARAIEAAHGITGEQK